MCWLVLAVNLTTIGERESQFGDSLGHIGLLACLMGLSWLLIEEEDLLMLVSPELCEKEES